MKTYWSILEKIPGSKLRLTKYDDEIHEHFLREFPDFDLKATIDEDDMKSKQGKESWREFITAYEKKVEDYNFGTMLRANSAWEYGEKETIFGGSFKTDRTSARQLADVRSSQRYGCNSTRLRSLGESS